jgi:SAM-dependent methyltransferase
MSSYLGRHAELYDTIYADKAYADEARFVHQCLERFSQKTVRRVLELACGTGSHALEFEKLGYDVTATDYSADMLARARVKGEHAGSKVVFDQQDMTDLKVDGAPFDAAVCLFDSIGYVQTNEALEKVMQGIHEHLCPGGLLVFEFWHAAAMIKNYDPVRVRRWKTPDGELLRVSETAIDHAKQLSHVTYSILELSNDGRYQSLTETQTNRYFLLQEMAGWLKHGGFTPVKWFAGFKEDENISSDTWHIVAVARRN